MKTIYLVLPCYNEEAVLHETSSRLKVKMNQLISENKISKDSRITFVDDGSKDNTWSIIEELKESDELFAGIKLSRNRGHQNALLAGLMTVKDYCDAAISLDADLQDDVNVIDKFIDRFIDGCDVVYGVRSDRKTDTVFKRTTAQGFYKVMKLLGVDIVYNHADYRLMSKRALEALGEFEEVNLFLRGIVPLIGYRSDVVLYERSERFAGESKYPLKKMLAFSIDGITSFSVAPLKFITFMGLTMTFIAVLMIFFALIKYFRGETIQGWTSMLVSLWFIGGIITTGVGITGLYIGKIYTEVKQRPRYFIEEKV